MSSAYSPRSGVEHCSRAVRGAVWSCIPRVAGLDNIGNRIVMGYTNSSDVNDMLESTNAFDIPRVESGHAGIISIYGKNEGFIISDN